LLPSSLPQYDVSPNVRKGELAKKQRKYRYRVNKSLPPMVESAKLPSSEKFDLLYLYRRSKPLVTLVINDYANKFANWIKPARNQDDYLKVFKFISEPTRLTPQISDKDFAWQRLSGVNPVVISRVEEKLPEVLSLPDGMLSNLTGESLSTGNLIERGLLYIANYSILHNLQRGSYLNSKKVVHAPIILFYLEKNQVSGKSHLTPILIQLTQDPGANQIITKNDGEQWQCAKWYCQVADALHNQFVSHLVNSHLVIEPFPIATNRQLSAKHPVYQLLKPHLQYSLAINEFGRRELFKPKGYGENLFALTIDGLKALSLKAYQHWSFDKSTLTQDIKNRGMEALEEYPFRDDARLINDILSRYVRSYLSLYYTTDKDVEADYELQAWVAELNAKDKGSVKGFPETVHTISELNWVLTHIIYLSAVFHSSVNYTQWDFMGSPVNMATSAYSDIFDVDMPMTDQPNLFEALPPLRQLLKQMNFIYYTSRVYHNKLGQYRKYDFTNPKVWEVVKEFQFELNQAEGEINKRNGYRYKSYVAFLPSRLANSLNS